MSDTTAAATLAENDRQAAELARYIRYRPSVMRALRAAVVGLRASDLPRSAAAIGDLLRDIEGPPSEPAPHDVDECDDRECAVCSEYHAGRDDGGTCQDEDSRFAPLINPDEERAKQGSKP